MARQSSREIRQVRRDFERDLRRPRPSAATYRRRRLFAFIALVVALLALSAPLSSTLSGGPGAPTTANTGGHKSHGSGGPGTQTAPPTGSTPTTTTTERRTKPKKRRHVPTSFAVASTEMTLEEPSSASIETGTTASGTPVRTLPTLVLYPTTGTPGPGTNSAAPPATQDGPFPLVVFSQGFDLATSSYLGMMQAWAQAGYVVAAPTYPDTDPNVPSALNESDIVNHPADLKFVISSMLGAATDQSSPLHGLIDASRIALIGHSDGGDVSLALAADSCCQDPQIRAAVILSGAELSSFGGSYFTAGSPPLLIAQGTGDTVNVPACSVQIYNAAPDPKYYLNIPDATHTEAYISSGPMRDGVVQATLAFLDDYVKGKPAALNALLAAGTLPGGEALSSGPTAPALSVTSTTTTGTTVTTPLTNTFCQGA